jgi:ABC-type glycerol-3-phosphate transport system substrate-binding protein
MARRLQLGALVALIAASLVVSGCGSTAIATKPLNVTMWGVTESSRDIESLIAAVIANHPTVRVTYQQHDPATYATELVEALAAGRGPDIFAFPAGETRRWQEFMRPAPKQFILPVNEVQNTLLQKKNVVVGKIYSTLTPKQLDSMFVKTVAADALLDTNLYGLPLAVDTLTLTYNQALLDSGRVGQPPQDWNTFKDAAIKLTHRDSNGTITQSGAALGTGSNISDSANIVALLMTQGGVDLSGSRAPDFSGGQRGAGSPSEEALRFYSDFSQKTKETYSWDGRQPAVVEAVAAGRVAMAFLTPSTVARLRQQQPRLPLLMTAVPQLNDSGSPAAIADYWLYGVAKASPEGQRAWGVLQEMTTNEPALSKFATTTRRGPTLRSVAVSLQQSDDPEVVALANQSLVARTWYHGYDLTAAQRSFNTVLDAVSAGTTNISDAVLELTRLVRLTYQKT